MRQSQVFGKTLREAPKDEQSVNAQLLAQAGYIEKLMSGVYSYLPLGLRVLKKIEQIIREEMNALGAQELLLPALHPKDIWEVTGRWETYGKDQVMYQFADHSGRFLGLGPTHEEIITPLAKRDISSYRDLPKGLYQFQTKFRSELRAKSGILRGREFLMKDLYSFHADQKDFEAYYERAQTAYENIFKRAGIGEQTVLTYASGGSFSKFSHEYQTITSAGEDTIFVCQNCRVAINDEIIAEQNTCPKCGADKKTLEEVRAIEVGNIFPLGTRFSEPFDLTYKDAEGKDQPVIMGCYGIGLGRLMGTIVEVSHDEQGMIWPASVAPYDVHLVRLGSEDEVVKEADRLEEEFTKVGLDVFYDDRDVSAGVKLNDADLIGLPIRVVVSKKTVAAQTTELKMRNQKDSTQTKNIVSDVLALRK